MDYYDFKIVITDGEFVRVALILDGTPSEKLKESQIAFTQSFERRFEPHLKNFMGDITPFRASDDLIEKFFNVTFVYPLQLGKHYGVIKLKGLEKDLTELAEQIQKERSPAESGYYAHWDLLGRKHRMGQGVSQNKKYAPHQGRQREQEAVIRPPDKPYRMGHDNPHKTDEACEADCRGGDERRRTKQHELDPLHVYAQLLSLFLVKLHHVKRPGMKKDDRGPCQHAGDNCPHFSPLGQGESTEQPEYDPVQLFATNGQQIGSNGRQEGAQCHPGKDKSGCRQSLAHASQRIDDGDSTQPTYKGQQRDHSKAHPLKADRDKKADGSAQPGSLGNANQVRVGQGIAKQPLVSGPSHRQSRPYQPCQKDTGKPDVQDYDAQVLRAR